MATRRKPTLLGPETGRVDVMRYVIEQLVPLDDRPDTLDWIPAAYDHVHNKAVAFRVVDVETKGELGLLAGFLAAQALIDSLVKGSAS